MCALCYFIVIIVVILFTVLAIFVDGLLFANINYLNKVGKLRR